MNLATVVEVFAQVQFALVLVFCGFGLEAVFLRLELGQFLVHFDNAQLVEVAAALDDRNFLYASV